jgi:hypothetical protein
MVDPEPQASKKPVALVETAAQKAIKLASFEEEVGIAFSLRFPDGFERLPVSGGQLLCGPRALIQSIIAQEGDLLYPPPTVEELVALQEEGYYFDEGSDVPVLRRAESNFTVDHLAGMLQNWGRQFCPDLNLRLGVVTPHKIDLMPVRVGDHITIWVWNDGAQNEAANILGHYEGMRPL